MVRAELMEEMGGLVHIMIETVVAMPPVVRGARMAVVMAGVALSQVLTQLIMVLAVVVVGIMSIILKTLIPERAAQAIKA